MGFFKKLFSSVGDALGGGLVNTGLGFASSLFGNAAKDAAQARAAQLQFENWQKTYNIQRKDALADYDRNLKDQRQLMIDQAGLQRQGMEAAGLNPAQGQGSISLGGANVNDVRSSDGSYNPVTRDAMTNFGQYIADAFDPAKQAMIANTIAQTHKLDMETKKGATETELLQYDLKKREATFDEEVQALRDQFSSIASKALADTYLPQKEYWAIEQLINEVDITKNKLKLSNIDVEYAREMKKAEWNKLQAEVDNLKSSKDLNDANSSLIKVKKGFAELGIDISSHYGSLLGPLMSGKGKEIAESALQTLSGFFGAVLSNLKGAVFGSSDDGELEDAKEKYVKEHQRDFLKWHIKKYGLKGKKKD